MVKMYMTFFFFLNEELASFNACVVYNSGPIHDEKNHTHTHTHKPPKIQQP